MGVKTSSPGKAENEEHLGKCKRGDPERLRARGSVEDEPWESSRNLTNSNVGGCEGSEDRGRVKSIKQTSEHSVRNCKA